MDDNPDSLAKRLSQRTSLPIALIADVVLGLGLGTLFVTGQQEMRQGASERVVVLEQQVARLRADIDILWACVHTRGCVAIAGEADLRLNENNDRLRRLETELDRMRQRIN